MIVPLDDMVILIVSSFLGSAMTAALGVGEIIDRPFIIFCT
jgi:hypothetical protein